MLVLSQSFTAASGSMGGITASRNRYGAYFRARVVPVNPNSTDQNAVRQALSALVAVWHAALTQAQRDGWTAYANATPVVNKLGASVTLTGQAMFTRCNLQRFRDSAANLVVDAPTVFDLGTFSPATVGITAATGAMVCGFVNGDGWATAVGGFMYVFIGRARNLGVQFYGGPFRWTGTAVPGAVIPPTSPFAIGTYPFGALLAGDRVFARITVGQVDGRYSNPLQVVATVA